MNEIINFLEELVNESELDCCTNYYQEKAEQLLTKLKTSYSDIKDIRDSLNDEIIKINSTTLKDDIGKLDVSSDPMQTKSFARGKSIGLIIARDRINKLL